MSAEVSNNIDTDTEYEVQTKTQVHEFDPKTRYTNGYYAHPSAYEVLQTCQHNCLRLLS